MDFGTWTCHLCRELRPDRLIGVVKHTHITNGVVMQENVRYCRDREKCYEGALKFCFLGKADSHL